MKKGVVIAGIVIGAIMFIFGAKTCAASYSYSGDYQVMTSFGADFYTYSYQATAAAANNVDNLGDLIASVATDLFKTIGFMLMLFGAMDICYFALKIVDEIAPVSPVKPVSAEPVVAEPVADDKEAEASVTNQENEPEVEA